MGKRSAYTLLELIVVVALAGALLALGVVNFAVLPSDNMRTPQGFLSAALKRARIDSQSMGVGLSLYYNEENRDIVACVSESGAEIWRINMLGEKSLAEGEEDRRSEYEKTLRQKILLKFYPVFPDVVNFASFGSSAFENIEIPAIRFHPDMASTPVRIVLKVGEADEITHVPDPFSGHHFIGVAAKRKESR